jgi:hypothetical protein
MKRTLLAGTAVVLGLGLSVFPFAPHVSLALGAPPAAQPAPPPDAPVVQSLGRMQDGLTWGMTHLDVIKIYNSVGGLFDRQYDPILSHTQPGVQMSAIEADRENCKAAFAASFVEFQDTPTGYDATGVKDEYTYRNHESIMSVDKDAKRRYLFFIGAPPNERLWKIYDEVPLKAGGPYGANYAEAVAKLQAAVGAAPRVLQPTVGGPSRFVSSDWQDSATHLRADDRSHDGVVGVVLEDKRTLANLPQLRAVKPIDPLAIDPAIAAITNGSISDPNAARMQPDGGAAKPKKKK